MSIDRVQSITEVPAGFRARCSDGNGRWLILGVYSTRTLAQDAIDAATATTLVTPIQHDV